MFNTLRAISTESDDVIFAGSFMTAAPNGMLIGMAHEPDTTDPYVDGLRVFKVARKELVHTIPHVKFRLMDNYVRNVREASTAEKARMVMSSGRAMTYENAS